VILGFDVAPRGFYIEHIVSRHGQTYSPLYAGHRVSPGRYVSSADQLDRAARPFVDGFTTEAPCLSTTCVLNANGPASRYHLWVAVDLG